MRLLRPPGRPAKKVEDLLAPFFGAGGALLAPPETAVPALARLLEAADRRVRQRVRLSAEIPARAEEQARRAARRTARERRPTGRGRREGLVSLARLAGIEGEEAPDLSPRLEARFGRLAVDAAGFLSLLRTTLEQGATAQADTEEWVGRGAALLRRIEETLDRAALGGAAAATGQGQRNRSVC